MRILSDYKTEKETLDNYIGSIDKNKVYLYKFISLLFSVFFISAPLLLTINLTLFQRQIYFSIVLFGLDVFVFLVLYFSIFLSILKKLNKEITLKNVLIVKIFIYFCIGILTMIFGNIIRGVLL